MFVTPVFKSSRLNLPLIHLMKSASIPWHFSMCLFTATFNKYHEQVVPKITLVKSYLQILSYSLSNKFESHKKNLNRRNLLPSKLT